MKDISSLHLAWRKYAIFWVSSLFLAPLTFGWMAVMLLSLFIDSNTTSGYVTILGIVMVSYFAVGSLAKAEVAAIRKEMEDNPGYAELTKVIMEAARKHAELNSGGLNGVEEDVSKDKLLRAVCHNCDGAIYEGDKMYTNGKQSHYCSVCWDLPGARD